MNEVINTEGLTKTYKDVNAVSNLSLNVRKGEIYGFLGLNGAGKTTAIRMMLGMINPDRGTVFLNGIKVSSDKTELWREIGYLVEVPYAYPELTVRENLEIIRRLRFLNDSKTVDYVIDKLKLNKYSHRKAKNLSLGNAQRLGLAKALIHNPKILILDEPANGLDPAGIFEIRELLTDLAKNHGVTIFISSHILGEISKFSTRIGIIHDGFLIQEINTQELEKLCEKRLIINTLDQKATKLLLQDKDIKAIDNENGKLLITDKEFIEGPDKIANLLVGNNIALTQLNVIEEDLESYFLRTIKLKD
ncbi:MAG: bacitracin ABC transporter ATP-binding protein [Marinilabiliales bacterium]|nr:MAG: bacitracin ABC transporter ATP-binding protein [Marinilabiliales bacterium]